MDGMSTGGGTEPIAALLATDDDALEARWQRLVERVAARYRRTPTLEALLFLIGIQDRGRGYEPRLDRDRKQDLIMEGTCCAFETLDLYRRVGMDADGFWVWERTRPLPELTVEEQEKVLRLAVLRYFEQLESS